VHGGPNDTSGPADAATDKIVEGPGDDGRRRLAEGDDGGDGVAGGEEADDEVDRAREPPLTPILRGGSSKSASEIANGKIREGSESK
jgi:hypothetical protein